MKNKTRIAIVTLALMIGISLFAAESTCFITTTPNCSSNFSNVYRTCGQNDPSYSSIVSAGGLPADHCTGNSYGALGCQNENVINCTFALVVTYCDGHVVSSNVTLPITPTQDNGKGPCP